MRSFFVDCGGCPVRDRHCDQCALAVLFERPPVDGVNTLPLDEDEVDALDLLVQVGLVDARTAMSATAERELLPLRGVG